MSCFSSWKGLELLAVQSKTQDASCLPALKVSDIEPTIPITPVQISAAGTAQCLLYYSSCHIYTVTVAQSFFHHHPRQECLVKLSPLLMSTGGVPVQYCEQPTNGLVYFRAMCSLNTLPEDLKLYVPLFCSVITKWVNLSVCKTRKRSGMHRWGLEWVYFNITFSTVCVL